MVLGAGGAPAAGSGYTGPGDVVSGARFWGGLRGYNGAYAATGTGNAVNVRRASDSATQDIVILTNGKLDIASANTFATVDATGTGAITGTTLTFTGGHVGDTITGGTVAAGTYIVSGASPTWTVNISQTVASATLALQYGLYITKLYDQTGNGNDLVQATAGSQPQLLPNGSTTGLLPAIEFAGAQFLKSGAITSIVQPYTGYFVGRRTGNTAAEAQMISTFSPGSIMEYNAGADIMTIYAGTFSSDVTITDASWHAVAAVYNNTSSIIGVDNTQTSSLTTGTNATGTAGFALGSRIAGTQLLTGRAAEAAFWPSGFSGAQITSMRTNVSAYWGTP